MRCAMKTKETIPFIVNYPEVFQCFNTFVSLILKHSKSKELRTQFSISFTLIVIVICFFLTEFKVYHPKDKQRYEFILNRIWEVTIMGQKSVPAVIDWLLDYVHPWDGVLFKFQIYELLSWLPPVDFSGNLVNPNDILVSARQQVRLGRN